MDNEVVKKLSPFTGELPTIKSVMNGLSHILANCLLVSSESSLDSSEYLKYTACKIENISLPSWIRCINMLTILDPHRTIFDLQQIQDNVMISPNITTFFPTLNDEIKSLISDCNKILKDAQRLSRKLNQTVQRSLTQRNYRNLIQAVETFFNNHRITVVAHQIVTMIKKIVPYCDGELLDFFITKCEGLQMLTVDYHYITLFLLPIVELQTKELQSIYTSLQTGSPDIETTHNYFLSGQTDEKQGLIVRNYLMKLQEVAPNFIQRRTIQKSLR